MLYTFNFKFVKWNMILSLLLSQNNINENVYIQD